jgi:hypothetical protein
MLALCGMRSTLPPGADWPTLRSSSKKGSILVLLAHGCCCLLPSHLLPSIAVVQEPQVPLTPVESLHLASTKPFREPHPEARRYRVAVKRDQIEVYEQVGPDYDALLSELHIPNLSSPGLAERLQAVEERYARYTPVVRFVLLDPKQRRFGAQRMCSLGSIDGWLELGHTGTVAQLASVLIPTLGTEQFYELW